MFPNSPSHTSGRGLGYRPGTSSRFCPSRVFSRRGTEGRRWLRRELERQQRCCHASSAFVIYLGFISFRCTNPIWVQKLKPSRFSKHEKTDPLRASHQRPGQRPPPPPSYLGSPRRALPPLLSLRERQRRHRTRLRGRQPLTSSLRAEPWGGERRVPPGRSAEPRGPGSESLPFILSAGIESSQPLLAVSRPSDTNPSKNQKATRFIFCF